MRISDWSSDVCSSDLAIGGLRRDGGGLAGEAGVAPDHQVFEERRLARRGEDGRGSGGELRLFARRVPSAAPVPGVGERKRVGLGEGLAVRVKLGGGSFIKTNKHQQNTCTI